tara:strand:+ start:568 stop:762 length:195 start_codon:yes stop_codon:yes gene_type:complete
MRKIKILIMKLNNAAWQQLKDRIEVFLEIDSNITDVMINYQIKIADKEVKNYLKMDIKIEDEKV